MSQEMETAGLASAGAAKSGARYRTEPGPCRNCGADVSARYCPQCGQLSANFHRPVWSLLSEAMSDSFSFDGRLARTLPALLFRPGHVTRAYLDGRRARYVPPFRLFLLSSLIFFSVLFTIGDRLGWFQEMYFSRAEDGSVAVTFGEAQGEDALAPWRNRDGSIDTERLRRALADEIDETPAQPADPETPDTAPQPPATPVDTGSAAPGDAGDVVIERVTSVYENQPLFFAALRTWAPRVSLLLLPVFALSLGLVYFWRRRIYVYDHLVTALHFQSFLYLGGSLLMVAGLWFGGAVGWVAAIGIPLYVYRLMRRGYRSGRFMSLLRTIILLSLTMLALLGVIAGIIVLSAMQV